MATKTILMTSGSHSSVAGRQIEASDSNPALEISQLQGSFTTGGEDSAEGNRAALALRHHQRLIAATANWQPTKDHDHPQLDSDPRD